MKQLLHIAAVLALSLASTAHATSEVTATLSNFQLTTTGTVTPYSSEFFRGFEPGTMLAYGQTETRDAQVDAKGSMQWVNTQNQRKFTIIDGTKGETQASWDPAPSSSLNSGTTTAHAHVNDDFSMVATVSTGADGGYAFASAVLIQTFWLEANSSITATWNASIVGSNAGDTFALSSWDHATGMAGAYVSAPGGGVDSRTWVTNDDHSALAGFSFEKNETGRTLTFTTSDKPSYVFLRVETIASSSDFSGATLAVPEPETWTLLLIGLSLVGASTRRRRRRQSH